MWRAVALVLALAAPAFALTPLPETCQEPDGRTSTRWGGYEDRFIILDRGLANGQRELTLADCKGNREVRSANNPDAGVQAYDIVDTALHSRKTITFDGLVKLLRDEGHEARIDRVARPTCLCDGP